MKYIISLLCFVAYACDLAAQNTFPANGNAQITSAKLHLQNNTGGTIPLLTFKDTRYEPGSSLVYDFLTDSDGLHIKYNNFTPEYFRFRRNGDFVLYHGKIGVGVSTPAGQLHVQNNGGSSVPGLTFSDLRYTYSIVYNFMTESDGLQIRQDNNIKYQFKNGGDFIVNTGSVGIGTTYLSSEAKLTVAGRILAREVKVEIAAGTGPDFVFEPTYNLMSLPDLEKFVRENKHLPDVPPARVMEEQGVLLGEMNMKLLRKVEELTLYIIDLQKEVNSLKKQNEKPDGR